MSEKETVVKVCNMCTRKMIKCGKEKDMFACPKCDQP